MQQKINMLIQVWWDSTNEAGTTGYPHAEK